MAAELEKAEQSTEAEATAAVQSFQPMLACNRAADFILKLRLSMMPVLAQAFHLRFGTANRH